MARKSSKEAILDAAERVIRRQGMAATTVEGVAAEAGVSKGGLFYHFSSKKDMLLQLIARYEEEFLALRKQIVESLPDEPNRLLKETIIASIKHPAKTTSNLSNVLSLLDDLELRQKVSEMKLRLYREITAGYPRPERAALAMLAADGLWVLDLFGGGMVSEELEEKIVGELLHLIDIHARPDAEPSVVADKEGAQPCLT